MQTEVKAIIVVRSYLKEKDIYVQSKQWKYKEPTIVKNSVFFIKDQRRRKLPDFKTVIVLINYSDQDNVA